MEQFSNILHSADASLPECEILEKNTDLLDRTGLPAISLLDKKMWWLFKNGSSDEIADTVSLAEHWARIMQSKIAEGKTIESIWPEAFQAASDDLTTARMQQRAVRILARSWRYGNELNQAYDSRQQDATDLPDDFPPYY